MSEPFIGEIRLLGFSFAPHGWAKCDGALLKIQDQSAVFSLLGTVYGGDGRTTFALPDLRGRSPISAGTGPGLAERPFGAAGGNQTITLDSGDLPYHNHFLYAYAGQGNTNSPGNAALAVSNPTVSINDVPAGIPVSGTVTIKGQSGNLQDGKTSAAQNMSGTVSVLPYSSAGSPTIEMHPNSVGYAGDSNRDGGKAVNIESPYLAMLYVIALTGLYPSRS